MYNVNLEKEKTNQKTTGKLSVIKVKDICYSLVQRTSAIKEYDATKPKHVNPHYTSKTWRPVESC